MVKHSTRGNRNTPTGVGKTHNQRRIEKLVEKHPHGRGEDAACSALMPLLLETPPRAWGRPRLRPSVGRTPRNTPTGVGKTAAYGLQWAALQKHPHGRGEDVQLWLQIQCDMETPPRAWGRHMDFEICC